MSHSDSYFIKSGYNSRSETAYFEDSIFSERGIVHQPDIYTRAQYLGKRFICTHILDIGCGRGLKLSKLHPEFEIVGVDFGENMTFCRNHYPFGQWIDKNLEDPHFDLLPPHILKSTLVLCSDVIEHLADPTSLLKTLQNCLKHAPIAILSTPERDLVRGVGDFGPPSNPTHVREWNIKELRQLLKAHSFDIGFLGLTNNNNIDLEKKTTLAILHGQSLSSLRTPPETTVRVVAFMTSYNEEDIIFHSISRLINAGVEVYLIDNWSSDNTVDVVKPLLGKGLLGVECFPPEGDTGTYDWCSLLERVEALTAIIPADWFIHHDVDEARESPWPELGLRDAIRYVNDLGFNAIDHTVINFHPVDNSFMRHMDFWSQFEYFEFGRRPGHFHQVKAWKNLGQKITLALTGGHDVNFTGRKVFPYKFLLRHYPVRSQLHGEKKILIERKPRYNDIERTQLGWHGHYDSIQQGHNFLRTPESLIRFDPGSFYQEYLVERISGVGILHNDERPPASGWASWFVKHFRALISVS